LKRSDESEGARLKADLGRSWTTGLGLVLLPWLVVVLNGLMAKFQLLITTGTDEFLTDAEPLLTLSERAHVYRSDLLLGFVLVPLGLTLVTLVLSRRKALLLSGALALLVQIVVSVEMAAYAVSGSFASIKMVGLALWWTLRNGDTTFVALPHTDAIYCATWVALVALVVVRVTTATDTKALWLGRAGLALCALGIGACFLMFSTKAPAMTGTTSLLKAATSSLLDETTGQELMSRSIPELQRLCLEMAHNPAADPIGDAKYFGKAKGYNLVFFILEAIPSKVFDPAKDSLDDMPNAKMLRENSLVARQHYTTFPLTNRALFSMFTSMYDNVPAGEVIGDRDIKVPGLMSSLKSGGYQTGYYGYVWRAPSERDDRMLASLGFDKLTELNFGKGDDHGGIATFAGPVMEAAQRDHEVLERLKHDVGDWTAHKQRFAAVYFPELGHDPWRNVTGKDAASLDQKGHALAVFHDAWLGEIMDELRKDGALENTIIVVTADHGLRSAVDPGDQLPHLVSRAKLDDLVMRVPLMIYVPRVVAKTVSLDGPTSHLDLMPTLLGLMGVTDGRSLEEGVPMWNAGIASRRLFLPMTVFGADGYFDHSAFYMENRQKTIYKNSELHFVERNRLATDSADAEQARQKIENQRMIEKALLYHVLNGIQ
jgi:arylsulfatase A-like enzyme